MMLQSKKMDTGHSWDQVKKTNGTMILEVCLKANGTFVLQEW